MTLNDGLPVNSVCCHPSNEALLFAASGQSVAVIDTRQLTKPLSVSAAFSDEVASIAVNAQGSFLAAGDDAGE